MSPSGIDWCLAQDGQPRPGSDRGLSAVVPSLLRAVLVALPCILFAAEAAAQQSASVVAGDPSMRSQKVFCRNAFAMRGLACHDTNCDYLTISCASYVARDRSPHYNYSRWISQTGSARAAAAARNAFASGVEDEGSRLRLQTVGTPALVRSEECGWTNMAPPPETARNAIRRVECTGNSYVASIQCSGSSCNRIDIKCCGVALPDAASAPAAGATDADSDGGGAKTEGSATSPGD